MNDKFQGLSVFFEVTPEGKLGFTANEQKVHNNLMFFFGFSGFFRFYFEDYCNPLFELLNKPSIIFNSTKTIIFGKTVDAIEKYMPYIKIEALDFFKVPTETKTYGISLIYDTNVRKTDEEEQLLFFANIISDGQ